MSRNLGHLRSTQTHFLRLYAAILRCHRILPNHQMRQMGNEFTRSEFEQHHPTDTLSDQQLRSFFVEWTKYLNATIQQAKDQIELGQSRPLSFGEDLDLNTVQGMSSEQIQKIAE
eukprot:378755_1